MPDETGFCLCLFKEFFVRCGTSLFKTKRQLMYKRIFSAITVKLTQEVRCNWLWLNDTKICAVNTWNQNSGFRKSKLQPAQGDGNSKNVKGLINKNDIWAQLFSSDNIWMVQWCILKKKCKKTCYETNEGTVFFLFGCVNREWVAMGFGSLYSN